MIGVAARFFRVRTYCLMVVAVAIACACMADASAHRTTRKAAHRHAVVHRKPARRHAVTHARTRHHRPSRHAQRPKKHARRHHPAHRRHAAPRLVLRARCGRPALMRNLHSQSAYVLDVRTGRALLARNAHTVRPIASISKLMTAIVARGARRPLGGILRVTASDRDRIKFTGSRLLVGSRLSRRDMYHIALMSSENRAASALSRDYPGGQPAFVAAMNRKARALHMYHTHFREPTGLSPHNVSTAVDLSHLVAAAARDPLIRRFSTDKSYVARPGHGQLLYVNSDPVIRFDHWPVLLQKTGFINEAGHGLVMRVLVAGRPETIVLLGAPTRSAMVLDAIRVHRWLACSLT